MLNILEERILDLEKKKEFFSNEELKNKFYFIKEDIELNIENINDKEFLNNLLNEKFEDLIKEEKEIEENKKISILENEKTLTEINKKEIELKKEENNYELINYNENDLLTQNNNIRYNVEEIFNIEIRNKKFLSIFENDGLKLIDKKTKEVYFIPNENMISYQSFVKNKKFNLLEGVFLFLFTLSSIILLEGIIKIFTVLFLLIVVYLKFISKTFLILNIKYNSSENKKMNKRTIEPFIIKYHNNDFLYKISERINFYHKYTRFF